MNDTLRQLYQDTILDHNRHPHNFGRLPAQVTHQAHGLNPLCGDEFTLYLRVADGVVEDVTFDGQGCAISTASASLLTDAVVGKRLDEVDGLFHAVHDLLTGDDEADVRIGKLRVLGGVRAYPVRVKCASLPWHVLRAALQQELSVVTTEE